MKNCVSKSTCLLIAIVCTAYGSQKEDLSNSRDTSDKNPFLHKRKVLAQACLSQSADMVWEKFKDEPEKTPLSASMPIDISGKKKVKESKYIPLDRSPKFLSEQEIKDTFSPDVYFVPLRDQVSSASPFSWNR
jgi:hypothetical protein